MRLLFLTSRFPFPPLKGDKIRAYYPIKMLSKKHQIDLLSFSEHTVGPQHVSEMKKYCHKIRVVRLNKLFFTTKLALGIFSPWPSQIVCYESLRMKKLIHAWLNDNNYDILHIVCGRLARYAAYINNIPKVIDWIDALSLSTERMYRTELSWPRKLLYYLEWKKMSRFEQKNISRYSLSLLTSQADKAYLHTDSVQVIPNGVCTDTFHSINTIKDIDLVFTGNMAYFPNVQAVEFFCVSVMPLILHKRPETTFYVAGTSPAKNIVRYHDNKNVIVTGYVRNLTILLNRSRIFIAPLKSGAGIQNKILEAMACKLPVVTTSHGNAGIQAKDDKEILVRDDPADLADAILHLLSNKSKRYELGDNAYRLIKRNFVWESMANRLNAVYEHLLR